VFGVLGVFGGWLGKITIDGKNEFSQSFVTVSTK